METGSKIFDVSEYSDFDGKNDKVMQDLSS